MTRSEGFSAIPNWIVRDASVSLQAVAVYVALASHTGPGGIHPSQVVLARESRISERAVRSALNELEQLGVVERVRRTSKIGRASNGYLLHPNGRLSADEEPVEVPAWSAGTAEVPARAAGGSGKGVLITPLTEEEPMKKKGSVFDDFWAIWPRREGRAAAEKAWGRALMRSDAERIVSAAREYSGSPHRPPLQYVPHASTWLNGDRWNDPAPMPREDGPLDVVAKWGAGNEWMEYR